MGITHIMPELPLDDDERNAFARHLDCVRVPELVWRDPASHSCSCGGASEFPAGGRGFRGASGGGAVDHAEERADRETGAEVLPGFELFPCPSVHSDLAALVAFSSADEDSSAAGVHVGLGERFADSQPCAPEPDDQRAEPDSIRAGASGRHHGDDLLDGWRVRRVASALVARRRIGAPAWDEIQANYETRTAEAIAELLSAEVPGPGRLVLWHGAPGTGKTHVLRALARRWADWCSTHVVIDPEAFLGACTSYLMDVLTAQDAKHRRQPTAGSSWCWKTPANCSQRTRTHAPGKRCPGCSTSQTACLGRA